MTCLEHYFENLLFHDKDVNGDLNKNALKRKQVSKNEEIC